jgi:thymidylate synthase ThyX
MREIDEILERHKTTCSYEEDARYVYPEILKEVREALAAKEAELAKEKKAADDGWKQYDAERQDHAITKKELADALKWAKIAGQNQAQVEKLEAEINDLKADLSARQDSPSLCEPGKKFMADDGEWEIRCDRKGMFLCLKLMI